MNQRAVHTSIQALPAFRALSLADRERFERHVGDLTRRVNWEAADRVELTDEMVTTTASHAALLIAGFEPSEVPFHNVASVIFHAGTIVSRVERPGPAGGVRTRAPRHLAGQSGHNRDPILLDWRTARHQAAHPERGQNVILHEFAHKLDMLDGIVDGMPPLPDRAAREAWIQTLGTNFRRLRRRGPDGLVRAYGATNPGEYFAVTTELFFTRPADLAARLPRVYDRLGEFYRQDPALTSPARRADT